MLTRISNRTRIGFTLLEVLVASGISLLLGIAILNAFVYSSEALEHATGRVTLFQRTRLPAERVLNFLNSSVSIPDISTIPYPVVTATSGGGNNLFGNAIFDDDVSTWDQVIVFRTTEDFLHPSYVPDTIMDTTEIRNNLAVWERDEQRLTEYVIWFEDDTNIDWIPGVSNVVAMARFDNLTLSRDREADWVRDWYSRTSNGSPPPDLEPGLDTFIIAKNVDDMKFRRRADAGIQIAVTARQEVSTVSGGRETKSFRYDAVAQTPTIQMNF